MTGSRGFTLAGLTALCILALPGCALIDTVVWGADGAEVIRITEDLIDDLSADGTTELICDGADVDLGAPADWSGRGAGEPERTGAAAAEQDIPWAQWSINIELLPLGASVGDSFPGDVLYRQTDDGLCVDDVPWTTREHVG
ncbi:hypothetical protein [Microbacterium soli]|uniref:Secreted protein n=1 Tax=Microbacterium soli TaxID=446075 RepID=A0ABP7NGG2_9MICO